LKRKFGIGCIGLLLIKAVVVRKVLRFQGYGSAEIGVGAQFITPSEAPEAVDYVTCAGCDIRLYYSDI